MKHGGPNTSTANTPNFALTSCGKAPSSELNPAFWPFCLPHGQKTQKCASCLLFLETCLSLKIFHYFRALAVYQNYITVVLYSTLHCTTISGGGFWALFQPSAFSVGLIWLVFAPKLEDFCSIFSNFRIDLREIKPVSELSSSYTEVRPFRLGDRSKSPRRQCPNVQKSTLTITLFSHCCTSYCLNYLETRHKAQSWAP